MENHIARSHNVEKRNKNKADANPKNTKQNTDTVSANNEDTINDNEGCCEIEKQPGSRLERSAEMRRMAKVKMQQYDDVTKLTMNEKIDLIAEIWRHF